MIWPVISLIGTTKSKIRVALKQESMTMSRHESNVPVLFQNDSFLFRSRGGSGREKIVNMIGLQTTCIEFLFFVVVVRQTNGIK